MRELETSLQQFGKFLLKAELRHCSATHLLLNGVDIKNGKRNRRNTHDFRPVFASSVGLTAPKDRTVPGGD